MPVTDITTFLPIDELINHINLKISIVFEKFVSSDFLYHDAKIMEKSDLDKKNYQMFREKHYFCTRIIAFR